MGAPFLEGAASVRGKQWDIAPVSSLPTDAAGLPPMVAEIAVRRGVSSVASWLKPSFQQFMPDPFVLKGMEEAVDLCRKALRDGKRIVVFGDYDVDGATSSAVLCRYFRMIGYDNWSFYIPDRMKEGYGPNADAIRKLREAGHDLLIVADSGTTAFGPLTVAAEIGFETIVIDHHQAEEMLPPGIVVNPKRLDETGEFSYLCTAGLAFLFIVALNRLLRSEGYFTDTTEPDLSSLLGIVALGTVADVVPLVGLNRAYVKLGLSRIPDNPGLRALLAATDVSELSAKTCGFVLGPCINAAGRIDNTRLGTELLLADDQDQARSVAERLTELNGERREMQDVVVADAMMLAKEQRESGVLVVYNPAYHPGLIGLAAARLKDAFDRPVVVIGQDGKGSARSVEGFDIGKAILGAVAAGLLAKGGGHAMAGGLTIEEAKIPAFAEYLSNLIHGLIRPPLPADLLVSCEALTPGLVDDLQLLAPFGAGNHEPRVILHGARLIDIFTIKDKHVKARMRSGEAEVEVIVWNGVGQVIGDALLSAVGRRVDLYGKLGTNVYRGITRVVIFPEDLALM